MKLEGKTFYITGGASGLGEATARLFTSSGANVILADINEKKGKALESELSPNALFVKADVTSEDSISKSIDAALKKFGALHGCVNCAGVGYPRRVLSKSGKVHPLKPFEQVIRINLIGTFNVLRLCAKAMLSNNNNNTNNNSNTKNNTTKNVQSDNERGVIINVASVAAFDGQIGQAAYSASKSGIVGMTLPIARDLASFGIRICTICPGIFETPMTKMMPPNLKNSLVAQKQFPKRLGKPSEFASLAKHIAENTYLNGEVIRLDAAVRMQPK